jgi:lipoprotein-releasing system ATP-binding protein
MSEFLLEVRDVHKDYQMGSQQIHVLSGLSMTLAAGEIAAVVGASGVGKSTLLHILGLLDPPDRGTVLFKGEDLFALSANRRAARRNQVFGFVFQFYHLIPELSAVENVLLPSMIALGRGAWRRDRKEHRERARALLTEVGLEKRLKHRPSQLSGGERQRVAIARALMNRPAILLCDEPTGNLDPETSIGVRDALWRLNESRDQAILLVTHDSALASRADRILEMREGRLCDRVDGESVEC